jgi:hypothetical protein
MQLEGDVTPVELEKQALRRRCFAFCVRNERGEEGEHTARERVFEEEAAAQDKHLSRQFASA